MNTLMQFNNSALNHVIPTYSGPPAPMNKLMQFYNGPSLRIGRVFTYRTRTRTSSVNSTEETTLYSRLKPGANPNVSLVPILDQWVQEGRPVDQQVLRKIINDLRSSKRFDHALQLSEWISDKNFLDFLGNDVSIRLHLISKVYGLKEAEDYFDNIPNASRNWQLYSGLLKCYVDARSLVKAEATMQKVRELGYAKPISYNLMVALYFKMKRLEKLDLLIQEMEEKGIPFMNFTYSIKFNAYAASGKIEQMEKVLTEMEDCLGFTMEWSYYKVASNEYLKAGATEKALETLKKLEFLLIWAAEKNHGYDCLLTLYASLGKKDEVYRIWNVRKGIGKFDNGSYLSMMSSLAKLDDLDGVEKIFEEWEAEKTDFDYGLPNFVITAYCKKGLLEKAESILNRLRASGKEPNASSWSRMALGYLKKQEMDKAVETMKKAILAASQPGWKPSFATVTSCLEYLKGKGDEETVKEIKRLLEKRRQKLRKPWRKEGKNLGNLPPRKEVTSLYEFVSYYL